MSKYVISILLVVALIFTIPNAGAEKPMEELDQEYDRLLRIYKVYNNGLPIYPAESTREEFAQEAETEFPLIQSVEDAEPHNGQQYLLTGTVVSAQNSTITLKLADGQNVTFLFAFMDDAGYHEYFQTPLKGIECNIYGIFEKYSIYSESPVLMAGATKRVQDFVLSHTRINYGK